MTIGALEGLRAGSQSQQQQQPPPPPSAMPPTPQSQHQPLPLLPPLPPPLSGPAGHVPTSQTVHYLPDHHDHSTPSRLIAPGCGSSLCAGCGDVITDPYILRVQPDLEWHARCLKCAECGVELNEARTCYVRDGKTYCKADYCRLFANRCAKCDQVFSKTDFVMRARSKVYHIDCFRCYTCSRQLIPGEEFAVRNDSLLCRADFDAMELLSKSPMCGQVDSDLGNCSANSGVINNNNSSKVLNNNNNNNNNSNNNNSNSGSRESIHDIQDIDSRDDEDSLSPSGNSETQSNCDRSSISGGGLAKQGGGGGGGGGGSSKRGKNSAKDSKTTRVRTVLNEKQLHTLRTCYAANPRPDALMKEQLVEMTGLSPRVIRVWFQNKRCKDKKKQILVKQMEHQQQKRTLSGVPMIATSPLPHIGSSCSGSAISSACSGQPIDVQSYVSPWGLHPHQQPLPDHVTSGSAADQSQQPLPLPPPPPPPPQAPFQQLVNAYQSLYPSDEEDDTCVSLPDPDSCLYQSAVSTRQPI